MGQSILTDVQLEKITTAITNLGDHAPFWKPAVPVFLASLLGFGTAPLLDQLKTRRENKKTTKEKLEKELNLLNGANTAIAFNIEAMIHTTMQQIMPHYHASRGVLAMIEEIRSDHTKIPEFDKRLHTEFSPMMTRCPPVHFVEVDFFKDLPFVLAKDPELIKTTGWAATNITDLKMILGERNKLIDLATVGRKEDSNIQIIERDAVTQTHVGGIEVLNAHQMFVALIGQSKRVENVVSTHYQNVTGPKLKFQAPPMLATLLQQLEEITRTIRADRPLAEPKA